MKTVFLVHRWLGLWSGILLLVVAGTGAALVWSAEIDEALFPALHFVPRAGRPLPLDALYEGARRAHPEAVELRFQRLPRLPGRSAVLDVATATPSGEVRHRSLFLDPHSGRPLGSRGWDDGLRRNPIAWLLRLHYTLFAGHPGEVLVALLSLALLTSSATGLLVYRRFVVRVLTFRVRIRLRSLSSGTAELHRVVGVWACAFNLVIGLTGFWFLRHVLVPAARTTVVAAAGRAPALPFSLDALVARAAVVAPAFVPLGLRVDQPRPGAFEVTMFGDDRDRAFLLPPWASRVRLAADGRPLAVALISRAPFAAKLEAALWPLHFGSFGGTPVKILYTAGAFTPPLLSITGFVMWWRRRQRRRRG